MAIDQFNTAIQKIFRDLLARGFSPPLHCALISAHGSIFGWDANQIRDGLNIKIVLKRTKGHGMMPCHLMVVDSTGRGIRYEFSDRATFKVQLN